MTITSTFAVLGMPREHLEEHVATVMDQLLELEEAGCGIHSAAVSADYTNSTVTIEVATDIADPTVSVKVAQSCIRAAIHAAGGHTPNWVVASTVTAELLVG